MLLKCAKALGSGALIKELHIVRDMTRNTDPNAKIPDILSRRVIESAHMVINKLNTQGRKRKSATSTKIGGKAKKGKETTRER